MAELYHSKANIPIQPATQISPGTARMVTDTGLQDAGKALTALGTQLHQINVARSTAKAVAAYNSQMADFKLRMQSADPATVNYDEEWNKFVNSQGKLTKNMSRDAAEEINLRLTQYNAHNYADIKKMELSNTRDMVMAEAPEVMEQAILQQVKGEFDHDPLRAKEAERGYQEWLEGVSPALRPDEKKKLALAYGEALDKGRASEEKQRLHAIMLANPEKAMELIPKLQYQTPEEQVSLFKAARATKSHEQEQGRLQRQQLENDQAGGILDQYLETGAVPTEPVTEDLQVHVDALNEKVASGTPDVSGDQLHSLYYELQDDLEDMEVLNDTELLEAATVLPREKVTQLREASKLNEKLRPQREKVQEVLKGLNKGMGKLMDTAAILQDPETSKTMLRELEEERQLLIEETKQRFAKGDDRFDITTKLNTIFEERTKGVLDAGYKVPFRRGTNRFASHLEEGASERERRHALINLLMSGDKYEREIEAAVEAGWFNE